MGAAACVAAHVSLRFADGRCKMPFASALTRIGGAPAEKGNWKMDTGQKGSMTRRGFLGFGSKALLSTGVFANISAAQTTREQHRQAHSLNPNSSSPAGKIALEEHFALPFAIWRADNRIARLRLKIKAKRPLSQYLRQNFYITTSGVFRTPALDNVMGEVGADRILYSVDYPYEDMVAATDWFDSAPISAADRLKIARGNAVQLFRF